MFRVIFNPFSGLHSQTDMVSLQLDNTMVRNKIAIEIVLKFFFIL